MAAGPLLLEPVAGRDGAGRAHGRDVGRNHAPAYALGFQHLGQFDDGVAGDIIMEAVVGELLELVHDADAIGVRALEFMALVVDLLDAAFAARSEFQTRAVAADDLEALFAHLLGQDHDRIKLHAAAYPGAADAVIPGRRPDDGVARRVHGAADGLLDQDRVGGAHLVAAGREVLAVKDHDGGFDPGQLPGQDFVVDPAGAVLPGYVVEVDGVERVLGLDGQCLFPQVLADLGRLQHFSECRAGDQSWLRHGCRILEKAG